MTTNVNTHFRIFVEKQNIHAVEARKWQQEICDVLHIQEIRFLRHAVYYEIINVNNYLDKNDIKNMCSRVLSEIQRTKYFFTLQNFIEDYKPNNNMKYMSHIAMEYLPGQYDVRADAAQQCMTLQNSDIAFGNLETQCSIRTGEILLLYCDTHKKISKEQYEKIVSYVINPVEMRASILVDNVKSNESICTLDEVKTLDGFIGLDVNALQDCLHTMGLSMHIEDAICIQKYFADENRNPTETELKVLDTYWSDHCRHTTFLTEITDINFEDEQSLVAKTYVKYCDIKKKLGRQAKSTTLMDFATLATKSLLVDGIIDDVDFSEEVNACSIHVNVQFSDGTNEPWLLTFKNETHNHPTEIEPYGGASTCLGGAIRDPLSGRSYVFSAMRISGAANVLEDVEKTLPGKLSQHYISKAAADGFSSYGNQIGLPCTYVKELYHEGYKAKRLEAGFVMGANPVTAVQRKKPQSGDVVLLLGGKTGRDGIGGAIGSSKKHTSLSLETSGAEVQKGNPTEERKLQRLFRDPVFSEGIKRCNDFGAGGVAVAVGELAEGLIINLDCVPTKYDGLNGTELAISESQERMAIVIDAKDEHKYIALAAKENLKATKIAEVTQEKKLIMKWKGKTIVHLDRSFLDTNGHKRKTNACISKSKNDDIKKDVEHDTKDIKKYLENTISVLQNASQSSLQYMFDSSIGGGTVLVPYGGKYQCGKEEGSAVLLPTHPKNAEKTPETVGVSTVSCPLNLLEVNPYLGASYAVIDALASATAMGVNPFKMRLSFQEYFKRMQDEKDWGLVSSVLLGAFEAQMQFGTPAIGGKDSMSGSFENLHVPSTFIAFAAGVENVQKIKSTQLQEKNELQNIYLLQHISNADGSPNYESLKHMWQWVYNNNNNIVSASAVHQEGLFHALVNMSLGNAVSQNISVNKEILFNTSMGSLIIVSDKQLQIPSEICFTHLGNADNKKDKHFILNIDGDSYTWNVANLLEIHTAPLLEIFPQNISYVDSDNKKNSNAQTINKDVQVRISAPVPVCIPVFPGTNCEFDTEHAFERLGATCTTPVFCNQNAKSVLQSLDELVSQIEASKIVVFAGGFSAGDEPDGAGKFISSILQNEKIVNVLYGFLERDGLILGICNGFQALLKSGWLPFGKPYIQGQYAHVGSATLTNNEIGRHISCLVKTKIQKTASPWLSCCDENIHYWTPMSHGEGRFICDESTLRELKNNNQIASVYINEQHNPNGSLENIEGLVSPGRGQIFGRMGHVERYRQGAYKNIPMFKVAPVIESGMRAISG